MLIGVGKNENPFILMKHRSQLRQLLEMPKPTLSGLQPDPLHDHCLYLGRMPQAVICQAGGLGDFGKWQGLIITIQNGCYPIKKVINYLIT